MSLPRNLVIAMQSALDIDAFVETGTYRARTALWASKHFAQVYTIERSEQYFQAAQSRYGNVANITFLHGDSGEKIREVADALRKPAIYWLDAHWSGGATAGEDYECPLIEELKILRNLSVQNVVLIDDARLFLAPPPKPHDPKQWPTIDEIAQTLSSGTGDVYWAVYGDVIAVVPASARNVLVDFLRETGEGPLAPLVRRVLALVR